MLITIHKSSIEKQDIFPYKYKRTGKNFLYTGPYYDYRLIEFVDSDILQLYNINYLPTAHKNKVIQWYKNWNMSRTVRIYFFILPWYKAILFKKNGAIYKYDIPYLKIGSSFLSAYYNTQTVLKITKNLSILKIEKLLNQQSISYIKDLYTIAKIDNGLGVMTHLRGDTISNIYKINIRLDNSSNPILESFNTQIVVEDGDILYVGNIHKISDRIPFPGLYSIDYREFDSDYATVRLYVRNPYSNFSEGEYSIGGDDSIYISSFNPEIWKINGAEYYVPFNVTVTNAFMKNNDGSYYVLLEDMTPLNIHEQKKIQTYIKQKNGFKIKASILQKAYINTMIKSQISSSTNAKLYQAQIHGRDFKISYVRLDPYYWIYRFAVSIDGEEFFGDMYSLYYSSSFDRISIWNENRSINATIVKVPSYEVDYFEDMYTGKTTVDSILVIDPRLQTEINIDISPRIGCSIYNQIKFEGPIVCSIHANCSINANIIQKFRIQRIIRQELYPFTVEIQKIGFVIDNFWTRYLYFEGNPTKTKWIGNNYYKNLHDIINPSQLPSIYTPLFNDIKYGGYYETVYVYEGFENSQTYFTAKALFDKGDYRYISRRNEYRYLPLSIHTRIFMEISL